MSTLIEEPVSNPFADETPFEITPEPAAAPASAIAEYSPVAAALADLKTRFAGNIYIVDTEVGMWAAKEARKEIAKYRIQLEKVRKEIKAPALAKCQLIDSEAKRIAEQIAALEDPIARQIQGEESRLERLRIEAEHAEQGRVAAIQVLIEELRRLPIALASATSEQVNARRNELAATRFDDSGAWLVQFQEYWNDAEKARDATIIALQDLYEQRANSEKYEAQIKADQEELATLRAEKVAAEAAPAPVLQISTSASYRSETSENSVQRYYLEKIGELCEDDGIAALRRELEDYRAEQDPVTATVKLHDLLNDWATTGWALRQAQSELGAMAH